MTSSIFQKGKYQEIDTIIETNQEIDQYFSKAAAYFSKLIDFKDILKLKTFNNRFPRSIN